jgi:hypothetical protein
MQYPVPQFTDVEDKIIGPLTLKQFFILLVTAGIIFLAYSLSKDYYVTGAAGFLVGAPGLVLTFAQFNGRPMYASGPIFLNFWTRPKLFVFRKESEIQTSVTSVQDLKAAPQAAEHAQPGENPRNRLRKIQYQLEQRAAQEEELLANRTTAKGPAAKVTANTRAGNPASAQGPSSTTSSDWQSKMGALGIRPVPKKTDDTTNTES